MPDVYNVSEITNILSDTIQRSVLVRGRVERLANVPSNAFYLKDEARRLRCFIPQGVPPELEQGQVVVVEGNITLYCSRSEYQIRVREITNQIEARAPICQCSGCESCQPQGGNQQCPPLLDPEYELCPGCYHESPDREDRVAQTVYAYFSALGGNRLFPKKERPIQIGSNNGTADVVLIDDNGSFAAIAECKGAGYVGHGIGQLKSYLSATDTRFGIFANRADSNQWKFYENLRRNQFEEIEHLQFKREVEVLLKPPTKRSWQYIAGVLGVALCICLTALIMQLDDKNTQIRGGSQTVSKLEKANEKLVGEIETLQRQLTDKDRQIERDTNTISELRVANKALVTENQDLMKPPQDRMEQPTEPSADKININTASVEELQELPNIGTKKAQDIVQYRERHGNFTSVEDITKVKGIGEKTLEKLRPLIRLK